MKYFVISQPKAGTFLCANLLRELGIEFEGLHYSIKSFQKYNLNNLQDSKLNRKKYTHRMHFSESVKLIKENSLGVGHISYSTHVEEILKNFKKILLLRDIDSTVESWQAWAQATGKSKESKMIEKDFRYSIEQWKDKNNVFVLDFYDMKTKNLNKLNDLQLFLFNEIKKDSNQAISRALEKDSLTKIKRDQNGK